MTSDKRDRAARAIQGLLSLNESDVERFRELAVELADLATQEAATVLFGVLDDRCPLGGVMQTVTDLLQEFPPEELLAALVTTLATTSRRAPHSLENVLRGILLSEAHRICLKQRLATLELAARETLTRHVQLVGQSSTYRAQCTAVLSN